MKNVLSIINAIERGFDDIEHRISNMDKEHSKYIRATVTRMNYMLNGESIQGSDDPAVKDNRGF